MIVSRCRAQELDFYGIDNPDYKIPTEEELDADQVKLGKPRMAGWRRSLWMILEDPASGNIARVVSIISILIILFGVTCFILETHPVIRLASTDKTQKVSSCCLILCLCMDPRRICMPRQQCPSRGVSVCSFAHSGATSGCHHTCTFSLP